MLPNRVNLAAWSIALSLACGTERDAVRSDTGGSGGYGSGTTGADGGADARAGNTFGGSMEAGRGGTSGSAGKAADGGASSKGGSSGLGGSAGNPGTAEPDTSGELFDPGRLPRFDIEIPEDSLAALSSLTDRQDERKEEYVVADLRYGDALVANVGLRLKGEGSFRPLDSKPALKLKFDEFVPKQTFFGLKRLVLNNMVEDPTFLAERLAYELFRAAGLPAPRCNNALVYVNGEFFGVYANVEAEDKRFLARWFASNEGNLYEEGQQDFLPGAEDSFELETNEAENDRTQLVALITAAQEATPKDFLETLDGTLDTTHFLRFSAAEAAVNQWDMYSYTVFFPNNFRIYENPADGRFVFLPWGMDMSMKPFLYSGRAHIPVFELARQQDQRRGNVTAGLLFRKCLESPSCTDAYANVVTDIADVYEEANLAASAARYYAQIRESVHADPRKEITNERFEEAYRTLLRIIEERPAALRADIEARNP